MSTLTKERIANLLEFNSEGSDCQANAEQWEVHELARIALASLEAEPYGYVHKAAYEGAGSCGLSNDHEAYRDSSTHVAVYSAPPAPVSVPDDVAGPLEYAYKELTTVFMRNHISSFERYGIYPDGSAGIQAMRIALDGMERRAAMLQAEPVSNSDELPLDYLQGHKDGLEWAAQLAEANHPQTGDWLYDDQIDLARAIRKGPDMPTVQGGNSPVIPDGWVMVPVELTPDMRAAWDSAPYTDDDDNDMQAAYRAMIAAAPQWKVK